MESLRRPSQGRQAIRGRRRQALRKRTIDQTLLIAILSVVSSLLGAVVGGLVTAYATRTSVDAQLDTARMQAEADRAIQLREARGRAYEAFLNAVAETNGTLADAHSCASDNPAEWEYNGFSPGPDGDSMYLQISTGVLTAMEHATCAAAAAEYTEARRQAEKAFNGVYQWGSRETVAAAERLMLLFPDIDCPTSGREARRCVHGLIVASWMHDDLYPTSDPWPAHVFNIEYSDVMKLGMTIGGRYRSDHGKLYATTVTKVRRAGCHDLSDEAGAGPC